MSNSRRRDYFGVAQIQQQIVFDRFRIGMYAGLVKKSIQAHRFRH